MDNITKKTGDLFGNLFEAFDDQNFLRSVELFKKRFNENTFDVSYFKDKKCLDMGCGGGRYSIALNFLGASEVTGIDVSETGIADAKLRAQKLKILNTDFIIYDGKTLPLNDNHFDCVIWSGVLMHMEYPELAVKEVSRVVKPGGMLYMLVYATGGLRWPLVNQLRNITSLIPFEKMDIALQKAGLDVNKRRTYLDDLYVPLIDFYSFERLKQLLESNDFGNINRWTKGRLDHEEDLEAYIKDLEGFHKLFNAASTSTEIFSKSEVLIFKNAAAFIKSIITFSSEVLILYKNQEITDEYARNIVIGQGHHRVIAYKNI